MKNYGNAYEMFVYKGDCETLFFHNMCLLRVIASFIFVEVSQEQNKKQRQKKRRESRIFLIVAKTRPSGTEPWKNKHVKTEQ